MALLLVLFFGLAWQGIMVAISPVLVGAMIDHHQGKEPKVWGGNLQFSEDGFLEENDINRIHHEIKVTLLQKIQKNGNKIK